MLCLLSLHPALMPPAPTLRSALSPSDRLAPCQERMIVFESCQDIKRGRSPTRGHVTNKLATSSKVRGNMTSHSASLIGFGLTCDEGMDGSCFNCVDHYWIHSPPEGNMCSVPIPCYIIILLSYREYSNNIYQLRIISLYKFMWFELSNFMQAAIEIRNTWYFFVLDIWGVWSSIIKFMGSKKSLIILNYLYDFCVQLQYHDPCCSAPGCHFCDNHAPKSSSSQWCT